MNTRQTDRINWLTALLLFAMTFFALSAHAVIPIVVSPTSATPVTLAAADLRRCLEQMYPRETFVLAEALPKTGMAILVGTLADSQVRARAGATPPAAPQSYIVRVAREGGRQLGLIAGADPRGVAYGVYGLLEKLGCGFHLSGDALPPPRTAAFNFDGWQLSDQPLVRERLVFNWHNFLSGCATWNLPDWQQWIAQSQKMGYNAIMLHAYGNNPMAAFTFDGISKPVGYLTTTVKGRDWSTMHVNDVRRLWGGEVFEQPSFGADAALVPDKQRVTAIQSMMKEVFAYAAQRDMGVYFAVDVDTPSANPQELVTRLPESARFEVSGLTPTMPGAPKRLWLPNPDAPEGYAFYRAEVEGLVKTYPQITKLVLWFRDDGTPWMNLKATNMPAAWQLEFAAQIQRTPEADGFLGAPGLFAVGKIMRACDRALKECGASGTSLAAGTFGFDYLRGADRFFPADEPYIGLDYDVLHGKPQLSGPDSRAVLREIGAHRPVIPVVWAQHDDGHYYGRPYTPLPDFASKLADASAAGFGVIHWIRRPLDLYFESLAKQVWKSTKDQLLRQTCRDFAASSFGVQNREVMGDYLEAWITGAPQFGRETRDWFINVQLTNYPKLTNVEQVVAGCRARLAMIGQAQTFGLTLEERQRLDYQRGLEEFIAAFHQAQGCYQDSQNLWNKGDIAGARKLMAQCHPEQVIEQFARFNSIGGIARGEQGLTVTLNTRWLSHIVRHRQALGLEPVRINFAPTSHDPLAQGPGAFTFYFGPDHDLWECWGEQETGAPVFRLPSSVTPAMENSAPAVWREISQTGIESDKPLTLAFRPILAKDTSGRKQAVSLLPGAYRLRLLLLDPDSTGPGQRVFEVKVADAPADQVDVFQRAGGARRVVALVYPVVLKSAGSVDVTLTPLKGKAILCGAVLEPGTVIHVSSTRLLLEPSFTGYPRHR